MASPSVLLTQPPSTTPTPDMPKRKTATTSSPQPGKRAAAAISNGADGGGDSASRVRVFVLHRSDGTEVWQEGDNGPTQEMLDNTPDEKGNNCYMRRIKPSEKKYIEWLKFLAEGVLLESSTDEALQQAYRDGTKFYFSALPEGYRLFEQVKVTVGENAKSRRDTYLYGHPKGPRKRYRSPADFLPHVKWLSMDVTLDPINCLCSACKGGPPPPLPPTVQPLGYLQGPSPPACATPTIPPAVQPPANRRQAMPPKRQTFPSTTTAVQSPVRVQSPLATQSPVLMSGAPAAVAYSSPHAPVPPVPPVAPIANLMASPTHLEREHDLQFPGLNIYRFGEMVWFQIHPHWAIGIVVEVPASADSCYKIQPLHSPLLCEQAEPHIDIPSTRLRPWVAWSTPAITNPNLDQGGKVEYENLPWSQEAHSSSVEVDASIIKSRDVDVSFSLIDKLTDYNQYAGVYYGAERFWVGDAVRLKASRAASIEVASGREILVVVSIYDQTPLAAAGVRAPQTGVRVTGDVYRLESHAQLIPPPSELPTAVSADLSARSRFVITSTVAPYWTYVLVARQITVRLEDVKGRWYPGSSLFRIMQGHDRFQKLVETRGLSLQEWDETGSKMNEMGTGGSGSLNGYRRFGHRHEAFVKAIPSRVVFTPLLQETATIENNMQSLGLAPHSATAAQQPPNPSAQNMHSLSAPVTIIDLTVDDNEGMEFLADHDSIDEEFMKRMGEDAASFLNNDGDFYGGL